MCWHPRNHCEEYAGHLFSAWQRPAVPRINRCSGVDPLVLAVLLQLLADAQLAPPVVGTPLFKPAGHLSNHLQCGRRGGSSSSACFQSNHGNDATVLMQGITTCILVRPLEGRLASCASKHVTHGSLQCCQVPEALCTCAACQKLPATSAHPLGVLILLHAPPPGSQLGAAHKHIAPAKVARQDVRHEHHCGEQR